YIYQLTYLLVSLLTITYTTSTLFPYTTLFRSEKGLTPKTERYNRDFLVKKNDKFKKVYNNEFIYNPMNMTLGAVDLNLTGKSVAVSGYYITMTTKNEFDSKYFATWLKTPIAIKKYKIYATGSLIERQRIQFPTLSQIKAYLPSFEEQQQIGSLYKRLDDIIELHQRKTTTLNKIKKIYFEKLFSIDKKLLPKLRFKYYDKLWELRKLENLIEESGSGGTPKSTNSEYYNGNIPFLSISDISKSNGYINSTEKYITETGLKNSAAWIVPKGAVSLAMYASVGKVAILNIDATTSQAFYNMVFDNDN